MSSTIPNDQKVVSLVSRYVLSTNIINDTFINNPVWIDFSVSSGIGEIIPLGWLANSSAYADYVSVVGSTFCNTGNCVADCRDASQLFNPYSPGPFGVCMIFANVSRSLANTDLWTQQELSQLRSFGFGVQSQGAFDGIANTITTCLTDACKQNPSAKQCAKYCSPGGPQNLYSNGSTPSLLAVSERPLQVCSQILSFADFDFSGIGVTISYFLQIVIAISSIAYLLLMQMRAETKSRLSKEHRQRREDRKDEFVSSLVEFHKAQCFFVVAVQIAALTLMSGQVETSQANMTVIPLTAAIGVQAPLLAYVAIARFGRHSSYLLVLTAIAWILSSATMCTAYQITYVAEAVDYQLPPLPSCGSQDLSYFCGNLNLNFGASSGTLDDDVGIWFIVWNIVWGLSVLILFSATVSWVQLTEFPRLRKLKTFLNLMSSEMLSTRLKRIDWVRGCRYLDPEAGKDSWLFYTVIFLLGSSLCIELYQIAYIWKLNLEDVNNWTFGQIVAVLAWAAPLGEFLNVTISKHLLFAPLLAQMHGIIDGSNFRFARSLTVARVQRYLPALRMKPLQKKDSNSDAGVQLIKPEDRAMSANGWSVQTVQEIEDFDSRTEVQCPFHYH